MMNNLMEAIREAADYPGMFLLYTIVFFLVTMLIIGIIAYLLMVKGTKKTALDGLMRVRISLNEWPQDNQNKDYTNLTYGEYLIGMQDPQKITKRRLNPRLSFMERAKSRRYSVSILLERYMKKYEQSGFYGDASWNLLNSLLYDTDFCGDLGIFYREFRSKALFGSGCGKFKKDVKNREKCSVYMDLPKHPAEVFEAETSCKVSNICITMEYCHLKNSN